LIFKKNIYNIIKMETITQNFENNQENINLMFYI